MKCLFAAVALMGAVFAVPASAADMAVKAARPVAMPAPAAPYSWAGFYIGGHAGYGSSSFDGVFDSSEAGLVDRAFGSNLNVRGALGGVQAGYLWQWGPWVLGPEFTASFMSWKDTTADASGGGDQIDGKITNLLIGSAKLGYAFNTVLVYGTVGAARADAKWTACDECNTGAASSGSLKLKKTGLALGGGVEIALAGPWTFGVDGTYVIFNDSKNAQALTPDSDVTDFAKLENVWAVKATVNYRFR